MTRKQDNAKQANWKEVMAQDQDFLRRLIGEAIQQVILDALWKRSAKTST